jgi:hypothetical protein
LRVNDDVVAGRRWFLKENFLEKVSTIHPFRSFEGEEYA